MTTNLRETIITEKIKFNAFIPLKQSATDPTTPESPIRLEGLARTTDISLSHHKTTEKCIKSLKKQAIGLVALLDHESSKVIGTIIGVKPSPDTEFWPITQLLPLSGNDEVDAPIIQVQHWLNNNVPVGMSIHGWITEGKFVEDMDNDEWWIEIDDMILFENSITTIPAQLETKNRTLLTNSCPNGLCAQAAIQVKEHFIKTDPAINEAMKEHELRKTGKKPKLEVNQMSEKIEVDKTEFQQMQQTMNLLLQGEQQRQKDAAEAAKKQEMEDLKQSVKKELEEELIPKFKEAATLAAGEMVKEAIGKIVQDREHTRPSLQAQPLNIPPVQEGGGNPTTPQVNPQKVQQDFTDPKNYPAVKDGKAIQGVTAAQLMGVN